jgi:thioredoxin-like negative regulator of GroEL
LYRGFAIFFGLLALFGLAVELYMGSRGRSRGRRMEVSAESALLGGGLQGLLRARAMALGSSAVAGGTEAAATLALADAMLASEYGLDEGGAALTAAKTVEASPAASARAQALMLASRALVATTKGHPDEAEALARSSVAQGHKQASPLFALGREKFRRGDLPAAASAFQAALVREPAFVEARVAWAEVLLERGEQNRAKALLLDTLRRTPDHTRARLLLAEMSPLVEDAHAGVSVGEAVCSRDGSASPYIASACDLARARSAWAANNWDGAVKFADAAGQYQPANARVLGRAAQLLACLGAVDRAQACLDAAAGEVNPTLPSLRWARLAIRLGRGELVDLPKDLPASSSRWSSLLKARIALATGGIDGLAAALSSPDGMGKDLKALAVAMRESGTHEAVSGRGAERPVWAYVAGMRARLGGKSLLAMDLLGEALHGHGDACRAAGEYLAACEAVGRAPDAGAFTWLLGRNARCVNLPAAFAATRVTQTNQRSRRGSHGARRPADLR